MPEVPVSPARFAFYGTLRRNGGAAERLGLGAAMSWIGPCRIPGRLYRVSWYPALVLGDGSVVGDLFTVDNAEAVEVLDRFEGFDPGQPEASLYMRRRVTLDMPNISAWVYVWNGSFEDLTVVQSGDWLGRGQE